MPYAVLAKSRAGFDKSIGAVFSITTTQNKNSRGYNYKNYKPQIKFGLFFTTKYGVQSSY